MSLAYPRCDRTSVAQQPRLADEQTGSLSLLQWRLAVRRANPCEATGLFPAAANVGRARHRTETKQHQTANSTELGPPRTVSFGFAAGLFLGILCNLVRVRWFAFRRANSEASSSRRQAKTLKPPSPCIDLVSQVPHVCLEWHLAFPIKVRDENPTSVGRAAQQARGSIERNR